MLGTQCAGDTVVTGSDLLSTCLAAFAHFSSHLGSLLCLRFAWCAHWIAAAHIPWALDPRWGVGWDPRGSALTGPHILCCGSGLWLRCRTGEGGRERCFKSPAGTTGDPMNLQQAAQRHRWGRSQEKEGGREGERPELPVEQGTSRELERSGKWLNLAKFPRAAERLLQGQ